MRGTEHPGGRGTYKVVSHVQWGYGKEETERSRINIEIKKAENFPKLTTDIKLQIQESQRTPSRIHSTKSPPGVSYAK